MPEHILPDHDQRALIDTELDTCMLVEAAAGTGKTTKIIDRMIALLEGGKCAISSMAAITFTRKAAAEMRIRFQTEVERQARTADGPGAERLRHAAENTGECFIGTIHSFCARLLRERPVEAGVPLDFLQIQDDEDQRLRLDAWDGFCSALYACDDPMLSRMSGLGMDIGDLRESFVQFADYPDIGRWPCEPSGPAPDAGAVRSALHSYIHRIQNAVLPQIDDIGNDNLLKLYRRLPFLASGVDWNSVASIERIMEKFDGEKPPSTVQKSWPGANRKEKKAHIEPELERWMRFRDTVARPYLNRIYELRYGVAIDAFSGAMREYDALRAEGKQLNFQDLLINSAALLRDGGTHVRRYFRRRFSHLLIDEFQDTDPIQAEVMFLLASEDEREKKWRRCRPRPGSLFIVGDPKQSIYRFRRADLVTYGEVRKIISESGGQIVQLAANFRSPKPLLDWVNGALSERFPAAPDRYAPAYVHLKDGHGPYTEEHPACVLKLTVPEELAAKSRERIAEHEAETIAACIDHAIRTGMTIRRMREGGAETAVRPGDFLIVTRTRAMMSIYARKLNQLGLPNEVTGGTVLNETEQIGQLHDYMSALVHPHNPVALAGALRGGLFGLDDASLYEFRRRGGRFDWRSEVPESLSDELRMRMQDIFSHFRADRELIARLPAAAAMQRIAEGLGLPVLAAAAEGGNVQAGSLGKAIELLRGARNRFWSAAQTVDYLGEIAASEEEHDGLPALALREEPIRIMNLHKVKGLQAPIVFLAEPGGAGEHAPLFHIDRSGEGEACGYLNLRKRIAFYHYKTIARPAGWEEKWAAEESRFTEAENQRLLYVAATRAENMLVISRRTKRESDNPWASLAENLAACPEFTPAVPFKPPETAPEGEIMAPEELEAELSRIEDRRRAVLAPGYHVRRARPDIPGAEFLPGSEFGTEWGSLVHSLLEIRMRGPETGLSQEHGLRPVAASIVREQGLPESFVDEALEMVESLTTSPRAIFARALECERRLTEVPLTCRLDDDEDGRAVLLSGVVDLAFFENGGWVLVDYKTDKAAAEAGAREGLTKRYRAQIENYVLGWQRCTEEPVQEAGIYYTAAAQYVPVMTGGSE